MGLLNVLFESPESIAKKIELDDEHILKNWQDYVKTVSEKKALIESLATTNNLQAALQGLKRVLELELADISAEEKEETELISELEKVEHSQKIKRVHKLEQCLGYVATKHEYVYGLLQRIHSALKYQMHIVENLIAAQKDAEKLIAHLKAQLELEIEVLKKTEKIETFHELFLALVKGEHIIKRMTSREKLLLSKMQDNLTKIFSNELTTGITYEWAIRVFNAIEDKVHEAIAKGILEGHHYDVDFEFVNRPEFINLVRETIQTIRKREVSEQMIAVFVHAFREWYNHERKGV